MATNSENVLGIERRDRLGRRVPVRAIVPPLWVRARLERIVADVAVRTGIDATALLDTSVRRRGALSEARREIAARIYAEYPHRDVLARAMGVSKEVLRGWLDAALGPASGRAA